MRESSLVTYCGGVIDFNVGTPSSVEFNFEYIWQWKKGLGIHYQPKMLQFYHVHPEGMYQYSETDVDCMKGFFMAFNAPINFNIIVFSKMNQLYSWKYVVAGYLYDGEVKDIPNPEPLKEDQIFILRKLSYG